ncbi:cob(I)yrinic acid a,c-diamide adenosyltransferase [Ammonicoccus fulvus]|uniref:Corrinoid adenosyltransferase n=1 Tax=Ammonicoccus fulvus TaxID=3138240 RepID=A0ABZ3FMR6_9ACTN
MVVLSRIYTRTGDGGETRLSDMSLARKTDPRVAAYGDVDEANSTIGLALAQPGIPSAIRAALGRVQNELFDLGADLSNPLQENPKYPPLRITSEAVDRLEAWCDEFGDDLPTLRSFILPGGTPAGATLHVARTICRRAERSAWVAVEAYGTETAPAGSEQPGGVNPVAVRYLNRLSDLLFICSRAVNGTDNEVLWVPGGDRDGTPQSPGSEADPAATAES